ncbi:substrate-binding domain-containing protein [Tunturibacter empetritectus]|uniref:Ribose transport system substrate-binding protein n=1 Tax=Tunturiibacter lichenicola TaxID=2051959 RepID=A0A7W8JBK6_9BACT|nr:substrate-binding domain-containing protein [Edaphobacter lichenicola]MBB5346268.1 ribose transport system substrate-binding protein [Edaphobacter lichenicola]
MSKIAVIPCFFVMTSSIASCHPASKEIFVIPRTTSTTISEAEHAGAADAARDANIRIRWNAPTREDDVQQQIAMVEKAVEQKCKGLILTPDQPLALMVPVQRALSAGVPTVILASALPFAPQKNLAYILNDDDMVGQMGALRIGSILKGKGDVAIIGINPQSLSSLSVLRNFVLTIAERFPNIKVVDRRVGANNNVDSELITGQVLQAQPNISAIFSLDSTNTVGAYLALKDQSLAQRIKLVGVQQSTELANAVRAGEVDSLIAENTYLMGLEAVRIVIHPMTQASATIKLPPTLITIENVNSVEVRPLISNDWRASHQ